MTPNLTSANWSAAASRKLLEIACQALGVSYESLELVRFGTNAVYRLHPLDLTARVSRPGYEIEWVRREMTVTRWLAERGFPAIAPDDLITPEPFPVYDSIVSFWPWVSSSDEHLAPDQFGQLIHKLHRVSDHYPDQHLPPWNPMLIIDSLLGGLRKRGTVSPADIDLLRRWHDWIYLRLFDHPSELGEGLIHGDAHIGNCLVTDQGPKLIDFDYVCYGPREWDLIPETLGPRRFGRERSEYERFAAGYGYDVTEWAGYRICALARELLITCWRLDVDSMSTVRAEGERRLRYWRREPKPPGWRAF